MLANCGVNMPPLAQDLTYTVKSHHNKKVEVSLLTGVSGFFNAGQMSALVSAFMAMQNTMLTAPCLQAWQACLQSGWRQ